MAFCLARAGKWDEGFAVMCQVMPEAQARYLMARVLEHQKQPEASRMQLQLAVKADPAYAPAREFLAELDQVNHPMTNPAQQNPIMTARALNPTSKNDDSESNKAPAIKPGLVHFEMLKAWPLAVPESGKTTAEPSESELRIAPAK